MDGVTISGPVEVLHLTHLAAKPGEGGTKYDLGQLRLGRDDEGCWAVATDSKVLVLARWDAEESDGDLTGGRGVGEGIEFGVESRGTALLAETVWEKKPFRWNASRFVAGPGWVTVPHDREKGLVLRVSTTTPSEYPEWRQFEAMIRGSRPSEEGRPTTPDTLAPELLMKVATLFEMIGDRHPGMACAQRVYIRQGHPSWILEFGDVLDGYDGPGPRNLRLWAIVQPVRVSLRPFKPLPPPAQKPAQKEAKEEEVIPELAPVLGGEGG